MMSTASTGKMLRVSARQRWIAGRRHFAGDASYFERKEAMKQQRAQAFVDRLQRNEERKKRRTGSPSNVMKQEFREWWGKRRSHEESLDRQAQRAERDWKIEVAVVLERPPVVLDDVADWEKEFDELKAYLAQFGKEYPKELVQQRTEPVLVTDEELLAELPPNFLPASRETEADHSGEKNSLDRKLKDRVFLLLDDGTGRLRFPESSVEDGESLQDSAKRIVNEQVGKDIELYFPSSSPAAVLVQEGREGDYFGKKKFFMRVQHDEGDVPKRLNHEWLDRGEIVQTVEEEEDPTFLKYLL